MIVSNIRTAKSWVVRWCAINSNEQRHWLPKFNMEPKNDGFQNNISPGWYFWNAPTPSNCGKLKVNEDPDKKCIWALVVQLLRAKPPDLYAMYNESWNIQKYTQNVEPKPFLQGFLNAIHWSFHACKCWKFNTRSVELGRGERQTAPFIGALLHLVGLDSSLESWHLPKSESNTLQTINNQQQEKTTQKSRRAFCSRGGNKKSESWGESQHLRPSIHFLPN